ncbi:MULTISPECIES: hypothetical protein [unclassified Prochlorococcus]|nr:MULTISPECIES: hypothetical protein [unclassified Prochlorococcus]
MNLRKKRIPFLLLISPFLMGFTPSPNKNLVFISCKGTEEIYNPKKKTSITFPYLPKKFLINSKNGQIYIKDSLVFYKDRNYPYGKLYLYNEITSSWNKYKPYMINKEVYVPNKLGNIYRVDHHVNDKYTYESRFKRNILNPLNKTLIITKHHTGKPINGYNIISTKETIEIDLKALTLKSYEETPSMNYDSIFQHRVNAKCTIIKKLPTISDRQPLVQLSIESIRNNSYN